jgi:spermidine/putrescine transport system substrate-binding protein
MMKRLLSIALAVTLSVSLVCSGSIAELPVLAKDDADVITLRVCNWEEYIDLGDWDEDEAIDLGDKTILGENTMMDDFTEWYYETYGKQVKVEYSCFGTNEDLYNQLTLGDTYDLICPSEYMIMKLMAEGKLQPLSDDFFDESDENNYYINGVSDFIGNEFEENEINGEAWADYAAGYMWGVTGILYNPDEMTEEDASTWSVFNNPKYERRITIKDNVRDSYFAAVGALKADKLMSGDFVNNEFYRENLADEMNDVSSETIEAAQNFLQDAKDNVYSFETDSGKADIVSGKIAANYQWSGDAVYSMDLAEEDDVYLEFAVPEECTNLWFDGWVMLKSGINGDTEKQQAAEAFINFISMPENAVRNMYYIGYTSVISGGDDDTVFQYVDWCYGADEDEDNEEELIEYPVGFFFTGDDENEDYIITTTADQSKRQLAAQYPSQEVLERSAIMQYFDDAASKEINQMWINVRCFNVKDISVSTWLIVAAILLLVIGVIQKIRSGRYRE